MSASMDVDRLEQGIKQPLSFRVADAVVGGLFAIDPLFNAISTKARNSIKGRADSLGFSWDGLVDNLKRHTEELEKEFELRKRRAVYKHIVGVSFFSFSVVASFVVFY